MKKFRNQKFKKYLSVFIIVTMMLPTLTNLVAYATADNPYEGKTWDHETTTEILQMVEGGLDLSTYFDGVMKGTTSDDLREWYEQGLDVNDVANERAASMSGSAKGDSLEEIKIDVEQAIEMNGCTEEYLDVNFDDLEEYVDELIIEEDDSNESAKVDFSKIQPLAAAATATIYSQGCIQLSTGDLGKVKAIDNGNIYHGKVYQLKLGRQNTLAVCMSYGKSFTAGIEYVEATSQYSNAKINEYKNAVQGYYWAMEKGNVDADIAYIALQLYTWMNENGNVSSFTPNYIKYLNAKGSGEGNGAYTKSETQVNALLSELASKLQINTVARQATFKKAFYAIVDSAKNSRYISEYAKYGINFNPNDCHNKVYNFFIYKPTNGSNQTVFTFKAAEPDYQYYVNVNKCGTMTATEQVGYSGATFTIYADSACTRAITTITTNSNGTAQAILGPGTYYIRETQAPAGTILDTSVRTFTVGNDTANVTITNANISGTLKVKKFDSITNQELSGAEFSVYEYNTATGTYLLMGKLGYDASSKTYVISGTYAIHGSNGSTIDNKTTLPYTPYNGGNFRVSETQAPTNYYLNGWTKDFTITTNNQVVDFTSLSTGAKDDLVTGDITVTKQDKETGNSAQGDATLDGAIYAVFPSSDIVVNGVKKYSAYTTLANEIALLKKYEAVLNDISVEDDIKATYTELYNQLYNKLQNAAVRTGTITSNNGIHSTSFTGLYLGSYSVVEIKASNGYMIDGAIKSVTLTYQGQNVRVVSQSTTSQEVVKKGSFEFTKQEADYLGDNTIPLNGAKFNVYRVNTLNKIGNVSGMTEDEIVSRIKAAYKSSFNTNGFVNYDFSGETQVGNTLVSDSNGVVKSSELPYGLYVVVETDTTAEYLKDVEPFLVNINSDAVTTSISNDIVINTNRSVREIGYKVDIWDKAKIKVVKIDGDSREVLENVKFKVYDEYENLVDEITTDSNGIAFTKYLPILNANNQPAKYYLEEISTKDGYYLPDEKVEVVLGNTDEGIIEKEVVDSSTVLRKEVVVKNYKIELAISKKSATNTNTDVAGATLSLIDQNGNVVISWETDGTEKIIRGIKEGTYTLREERAPFGYVIAEEITITVSNTNEVQRYTMYDDEVYGLLQIHKTDAEDGSDLSGVVFEIRDTDGNVIETIVTDENGYAISNKLPFATFDSNGNYVGVINYKLYEVMSRPGYADLVEPVDFFFEYEGDTVDTVYFDANITNEKIKVSISKKSLQTDVVLSGAVLALYDENGELVERWTTDGNEHIITGISAGKYTLKEERTPQGYVVADEMTIEVLPVADTQYFYMYDSEVYGQIIVHKVSSVTGESLSGVKFEIRDMDGNVIETLITDENGYAISSLLPAFTFNGITGEYIGVINYALYETVAKNGYQLDDTAKFFSFDYQGEEKDVVKLDMTVENTPIPGIPIIPETPPLATGDNTQKKALIFAALFAAQCVALVMVLKKKKVDISEDSDSEE